ncbi:Uma2 family endonuclease [Candidatus Thiodictyon syntrophicum]|jgi:hypothetical protein|uniref:Uncharacterized protein n=1 Tax=Candidatus Thiodictyon syntrophicum TaxID=1166950 RepID=A0A2K8UCM3_9GAMM|nr:Uma2 family endonuclease [Candidatus Thiodictyon syntrophicum]AUB83333.1 hypothetical protein THSYN_21915 [Candidatus Thiodictyon syntrophicum]
MGLPQCTPLLSVGDYLSFERADETRHEYLDGLIYAMAGESLEHSTISANLIGILHGQLHGRSCRVLSPGTESFDRGEKFQRYRAHLESLEDFVLVSSRYPTVGLFLRRPGGFWLYSEVAGLAAALVLPSIGCTVPLAQLYERVELPLRPQAPDTDTANPSLTYHLAATGARERARTLLEGLSAQKFPERDAARVLLGQLAAGR